MTEKAAMAAGRSGSLAQSNPLLDARRSLEEAEQARRSGQLSRAQKILEGLVAKHKDYVAALHTLGLIHSEKNEYDRALLYVVRASMLNPHDWTILTALSVVYLRLGASQAAAQTLERALALSPDNAGIFVTVGEILREEREYERAAEAFREASRLDPSLGAAFFGLGLVSTHLGRFAEAADSYRALSRLSPLSAEALYAVSQLPHNFVDPPLQALVEAAVMDERKDKFGIEPVTMATRAVLQHKSGRYRDAWENLVKANAPVARVNREHWLKMQKAQEASLERARGSPAVSFTAEAGLTQSLFIFGPSRSGKTSLERLVSSLPGMSRGYENPSLETAVRRTFQEAGLITSNRLSNLPSRFDDFFRRIYSDELHRRSAAVVFSNTTPGLVHDAVRIAGTVPNARFVFMMRDIEDLTLRIYMRRYSESNYYAGNIRAIRDYIDWYAKMTQTLTTKFGSRSLVVSYDEMVSAPHTVVSAVAELCGLTTPTPTAHDIGDDRGCSRPYREWINQQLE